MQCRTCKVNLELPFCAILTWEARIDYSMTTAPRHRVPGIKLAMRSLQGARHCTARVYGTVLN